MKKVLSLLLIVFLLIPCFVDAKEVTFDAKIYWCANGSQGPHSNPQSNDFGDFAKDNYYYVRELMGIYRPCIQPQGALRRRKAQGKPRSSQLRDPEYQSRERRLSDGLRHILQSHGFHRGCSKTGRIRAHYPYDCALRSYCSDALTRSR